MAHLAEDPEIELLSFEGEGEAVSSGPCRICNGTGWELVEQLVEGRVARSGVKRCRCWSPVLRIQVRQKRRTRSLVVVAAAKCRFCGCGEQRAEGCTCWCHFGSGDGSEVDQKTLASGGR
jgi:hypothetical protein